MCGVVCVKEGLTDLGLREASSACVVTKERMRRAAKEFTSVFHSPKPRFSRGIGPQQDSGAQTEVRQQNASSPVSESRRVRGLQAGRAALLKQMHNPKSLLLQSCRCDLPAAAIEVQSATARGRPSSLRPCRPRLSSWVRQVSCAVISAGRQQQT